MRIAILVAAASLAIWAFSSVQAQNPEIVVWVTEEYELFDYSAQNPTIYIRLESTDSFSCYNYYFPTSVTTNGTVKIAVGEPVAPYLCETAIGPARSRVKLPIGEGVFTLELVTWLGTDTYQLTVLPDRLDFAPMDASVTSPAFTRTYRYPEDSFVFRCYGPACYDILSSLRAHLQLDEFSIPTDGLSPYPSIFSWPVQAQFTYNADTWPAVEQWAAGAAADGLCASFWLTNWRSEQFSSWVSNSTTPTPSATSTASACNLSLTPAPTASSTVSTSPTALSLTAAALPISGGKDGGGEAADGWLILILGASLVALGASWWFARRLG